MIRKVEIDRGTKRENEHRTWYEGRGVRVRGTKGIEDYTVSFQDGDLYPDTRRAMELFLGQLRNDVADSFREEPCQESE